MSTFYNGTDYILDDNCFVEEFELMTCHGRRYSIGNIDIELTIFDFDTEFYGEVQITEFSSSQREMFESSGFSCTGNLCLHKKAKTKKDFLHLQKLIDKYSFIDLLEVVSVPEKAQLYFNGHKYCFVRVDKKGYIDFLDAFSKEIFYTSCPEERTTKYMNGEIAYQTDDFSEYVLKVYVG